jgi:hypothetical protein
MHRAAVQTKEVLSDALHHLGAPERCLWAASGCCTAATVMLEGGFAQSHGVGSRALPLGSSSRSSSQLSSSGRRRCRGVCSNLATGSTMPHCLLYGTTLNKSARCGLLSRAFSQRSQGLVPVRFPVRAHKKAPRDSELRAVYRTAWSGAVSGQLSMGCSGP